MSEIETLSLERLNNGAHFLFISNVLARAEADANVKSKLSVQIVSLKAAMEQEDEDLKISQKVCWQMTSLQPMLSMTDFTAVTKRLLMASEICLWRTWQKQQRY